MSTLPLSTSLVFTVEQMSPPPSSREARLCSLHPLLLCNRIIRANGFKGLLRNAAQEDCQPAAICAELAPAECRMPCEF